MTFSKDHHKIRRCETLITKPGNFKVSLVEYDELSKMGKLGKSVEFSQLNKSGLVVELVNTNHHC